MLKPPKHYRDFSDLNCQIKMASGTLSVVDANFLLRDLKSLALQACY